MSSYRSGRGVAIADTDFEADEASSKRDCSDATVLRLAALPLIQVSSADSRWRLQNATFLRVQEFRL